MPDVHPTRRDTSFGWLEVLAASPSGEPLVERLWFVRKGRAHQHDLVEHCRIMSGSGVIVCGDQRIAVQEGDSCSIPALTDHWMEPGTQGLEIVLMYVAPLS